MNAIQKAVLTITATTIVAADAHAGRWLSHDPIQEGGGFVQRDPNPYVFVLNNPASFIDALGLRPINVEFDAFIPGRLGSWLPEPFPFSPWFFATDDRGFGGGSARLHATATIESLDIGKNAQPRGGFRNWNYPHKFWSDPSRRRKVENGAWVYDAPATATASGLSYLDDYKCRSELRFVDVHAAYGYHQTLSPDIDFSVTFRFEVVGRNTVKVTAYGSHNRFPNYEGLVDSGLLYSYDTSGSGPGLINLNTSTSFTSKSIIIDAETSDCCPPSK
jgi:hypothetical protein